MYLYKRTRQTDRPPFRFASLLCLSIPLFLFQTMSVVFQCVYVSVSFFCVIIKKADFKFIASLKLNTQRHECASFAFSFPLYSCIR